MLIDITMIDRRQIDRTMTHAGFGADFFGKTTHRAHRSAQKQGFQAVDVTARTNPAIEIGNQFVTQSEW